MKSTRVALCLNFAFLFYVVGGAMVTFTNRCEYTVWPGTFAGDQKPQLSTTGFELGPGATTSVDLPSPWSGRFWGRTGCSNNNGRFSCATADCASGQVGCNGAGAIPPATLVEITVASNGGQDFYDVSNVDGFNVPMSVTPQGGSGDCKTSSCPGNINVVCPSELQVIVSDGFNVPISVTPQGGSGDCKASSCPANINDVCPAELQLKGSDWSVIACKSACLAFNTDQYCCRGSYNTEATCPPTNYSMVFENQCPDAYSYAYDDKSSTFTCSAGPDYAVTFCP